MEFIFGQQEGTRFHCFIYYKISMGYNNYGLLGKFKDLFCMVTSLATEGLSLQKNSKACNY